MLLLVAPICTPHVAPVGPYMHPARWSCWPLYALPTLVLLVPICTPPRWSWWPLFAPPTVACLAEKSNWTRTGASENRNDTRPAEWSRTGICAGTHRRLGYPSAHLSGDLSGSLLLARFHSAACPKLEIFRAQMGWAVGAPRDRYP